jgi:hypothetical protein
MVMHYQGIQSFQRLNSFYRIASESRKDQEAKILGRPRLKVYQPRSLPGSVIAMVLRAR